MTVREWFTSIALAMIVVGATLIAQPPTVSNMYPVAIERMDFTAAAGQAIYQTPVPARTNFVMVFRNGLLQRSCATCDYIATPISGVGLKVTFNPGPTTPGEGDYVTLFYYR